MASARRRRKRLLFNPIEFPFLNNSNHRVTSEPDENHNCIAYAAGDKSHVWWPRVRPENIPAGWRFEYAPRFYWPPNCPEAESVEAFIAAFASVGYSTCENADLEDGYEKIAIFAVRAKD